MAKINMLLFIIVLFVFNIIQTIFIVGLRDDLDLCKQELSQFTDRDGLSGIYIKR